ncbi:hypothetical protein JCGZ_10740 [Jatropha curcas]|uniref:Uncharacterized protein n=1 Tax=Jatropha curcas TaxID=180498 RepID=A0A067LHY5_JATCU|nr:uncharacterized protein LOC105635335 [Jatropha curcas]KDP47013.1 hypothetical protein JCGZ_10740 [Jatropha curcas]
MALTGNNLILQNRVPIPIGLPFSNPRSKPIVSTSQSNPPLPLLHCNHRPTSLSCTENSAVSDGVSTSSSSSSIWSQFAANVSGEWDGYGADFTSEGKPIELPESVVPEAYREWEVKVFDWQTQCPTLAQPNQLLMTHKTIKLLPTVGCEADAATRYSINERVVGGLDNKVSAFAYKSSGSYVAVWPIHDNQFELEHCLINPQDKESRVRIIQIVDLDNRNMRLKNIRVFCEQWYGPFRNGDQLGGCAIRDTAFASAPALEASQVVGLWQGPRLFATYDTSQTGFLQELKDESIQKSVIDEHNIILLPKQLWCSVKGSSNGETCCEAGWLFDYGSAITSRCIFSSNVKLKEISLARETATTQGV